MTEKERVTDRPKLFLGKKEKGNLEKN